MSVAGADYVADTDYVRKQLDYVRRFGPDYIPATPYGRDGTLDAKLVRLLIELEHPQFLRELKRLRFPVKGSRRRRRSAAETKLAVRLLRDEGLVVGAIADKLRLSDVHVRRLLAEIRSETSKTGL